MAFGGDNLANIERGQQWLDNTAEYAGRIPGQIAATLRGVRFTSFSKFRQAFWAAINEDPILSEQFSSGNRGNLKNGKAPKASADYQYVSDTGRVTLAYTLHHYTPIEDDYSGVYDLDNIVIVNPLQHYRIHYGG